jgi:hypothetical protein
MLKNAMSNTPFIPVQIRRRKRSHMGQISVEKPTPSGSVLSGIQHEPHRRDRRARLEELTTGDGRPFPAHLKAQISRELDRFELVLKQIRECEQTRDALLTAAQSVASTEADNLMPAGQSAQPALSVPAMLLDPS